MSVLEAILENQLDEAGTPGRQDSTTLDTARSSQQGPGQYWTGAGFKHGHCVIRNYLDICGTVLPIIILQFDVHTVWSAIHSFFIVYNEMT